jgi:hypothetical protein
VPRKIIDTLTLSNLKSVHTLIFTIILYKAYSVATLEPLEPFPLNNYVRVVALAPDLQAASFHNAREFFRYLRHQPFITPDTYERALSKP